MIIRWIFITSCQMATYHLCGSFTKGVTADDRRFHTEDEHDNLPSVWLVYRGRYSRWRKILYRGWAWQLTICVARLQRVLQQMMEDTIQRMSMTTYHLCGSFTEGVTADGGRYYTRLRAWQLTICVYRLHRALWRMMEDTIQEDEHDN